MNEKFSNRVCAKQLLRMRRSTSEKSAPIRQVTIRDYLRVGVSVSVS